MGLNAAKLLVALPAMACLSGCLCAGDGNQTQRGSGLNPALSGCDVGGGILEGVGITSPDPGLLFCSLSFHFKTSFCLFKSALTKNLSH